MLLIIRWGHVSTELQLEPSLLGSELSKEMCSCDCQRGGCKVKDSIRMS